MRIGKDIYNIYRGGVQHYSPSKYWERRNIVVSANRIPKILKIWYLMYLRKCDAFNCAEIATGIGAGAYFATPPILPHGLKGIIIHPTAKIGRNCTIHQQVTIGTRNTNINKSATIGDNCFIGAGAKILGDITIGDNVRIGANAVVIDSVPSNCTVVGVPAKIIKRNS